MTTEPEANKSGRLTDVGSGTLVRCWWKVAHRDNYEIGGEHKTLEDAEYYLTKCLSKRLQKQCHLVRFELHKIEAPNERS